MQLFKWINRDSAAQDMLQLVKHGPESVQLGALSALQAIRSSQSTTELKSIALDTTWPFKIREAALKALATFPEELYFPELEPLLKDYWNGRWKTVEPVYYTVMPATIESQLRPELHFYSAVLHFIGRHLSNQPWLFEIIKPLDPTAQIKLLRHAIGATCETPLEPVLMDLLIEVLTRNPLLFDLDVAEEIANHGNDKSDQWLVQQADRIVALSESGDNDLISAVLNYSPKVKEAVIALKPALSDLDRFNEVRQLPEGVVAPISYWKPDYDYTSTLLGQQIQQLYTLAASGDDKAFTNLCVLADDYRVSLTVKAVVTHFIGKLWPHESALEWLCILLRDNDVWDNISDYMPVRLEAAEALRNTETVAAWEAMIDIVFLTPPFNSTPYIDWLTDLTDALSDVPSVRKIGSFGMGVPGVFRKLTDNEPCTRKDFVWTVEDRPWFQRLGDMTDDLNAILKDQ